MVGRVRVVAREKDLALGIRLAESVDRPFAWPGLGRRAPPPFTLILASDSASMSRIASGRAPGWGAGITLPSARTIVLRSDLGGLDQTLRHEVAHLALHDAVPGRFPLWFDEGYASLASGEFERLITLQLNLAVVGGKLPSLRELDSDLRGSARTADAAYGLAASAVAEIARHPAPGGLERLFNRMAAGDDFEQSLIAATGLTPDRFEKSWQAGVRRRYGFIAWLLAGGIWAVVAAVLGVLVWLRRRSDRPRRMALDQGWEIPPPDPPPPPVDPVDPKQ
jgi:peptidase MA superfamily protein